MPRRMISQVIAGQTLVTAEPQTTVRAAARMMAEKRVGAVLVLESGRLAGIFTERDALNKVLAVGLDADDAVSPRVDAPRRHPRAAGL